MALVLKDRVLETCTSPGTGTVTLLGSPSGYQTFSSAIGNANTTYYVIADQTGPNWEVGIGTYTSAGNTLARTTVLASSAGGAAVNFNTGTQNVWCDYPSGKAVYSDASGNVSLPGTLTAASTIQATAGGFKFPDATTQTTAATSSIPAGSVTNFFNAAAPTGWAQVVTYTNHALRIVGGVGGGTGGSVAFTTAFASQTPSGSVTVSAASGTVGSYTLTATDIPAHSHGVSDPGHNHSVNDPSHNHSVNDPSHSHTNVIFTRTAVGAAGATFYSPTAGTSANYNTATSTTGISNNSSTTGISNNGSTTGISTTNTGGGGGHSHSLAMNAQSGSFTGNAINLAVQYLDNILCTKS